ncbi:MAG: insulinase family protein [Flavobacteriales bacterium]|nr:insulinase family protein [Flavobacteriales bacterium]
MKTLKYILPLLVLFLAACSGGKVDRSIVPQPGPAPQISIGDYETFSLGNGLRVIVVNNDKLPRVSYQLTIDRDPIMEGNKAGYVSMAGDLLSAGTAGKTKAQIDQEIDFMGASLSTFSTGMYGACLTKHSDNLLSLMQEMLMSPAFPEDELEKLRKQTLSGLASSKSSADDISRNISNAICYGLDHPYGEQQTEKTTEAISRDDLIGYYQDYFKPNLAYLVIVGDISMEQAKSQAEKYFGGWEAGQAPQHAYDKPTPPRGNRVAFVPLSGAVQSVIDINHPVDMTPGHPDAIAASVMNNILGGGVFGGRLMQNLREDKAFTYGARSSTSPDPVIGSFNAYASVRNEVTDSSVTEFLYEIERLTRERVADTTLRFIKNYMNGSFARSLESPQTIARFALNIERYDLPKDYYATYLTKLEAVTTDDVLRVAQRYLKPNNLNITVVGNKEEVAESLAKFAKSGEVEFFDIYGGEYIDLEAAPEGMTAQNVFDAYYAAIGGKENLAKVNSIIEEGSMGVSGMSLAYNRKVKGTDQMVMTVAMGGQTMMKQVIDGDRGSSSQMGQSIAMTEEEISEAKMQLDMLAYDHLADYGMSAVLKGIDTDDNGQRMYVVDLMKGEETSSTQYYSVDTGLLVSTVSTEETPQGGMTVASMIEEYKEFSGIQFPVKVSQVVGPQVIEVTLDNVSVNKRISNSEFKVD